MFKMFSSEGGASIVTKNQDSYIKVNSYIIVLLEHLLNLHFIRKLHLLFRASAAPTVDRYEGHFTGIYTPTLFTGLSMYASSRLPHPMHLLGCEGAEA